MRSTDLRTLFAYNYWATWQVLAAVREIPADEFTAGTSIAWRGLRDTLVHTLDVEQSWRRRLQGADESVWSSELPADRFETPGELETYWRTDAAEMLDWLDGLDDAALAKTIDLGPKDRFPLWFFLVHIVTHGIEQRRDTSILLKNLGHEPPELEFLWYADSIGAVDGL